MEKGISIGEIHKAIERLQAEHPAMFNYDVSSFDADKLDPISELVEKLARRHEEDAEIHIICEMAKEYLAGARPYYVAKGRWERISDNEWKCSHCGGVIQGTTGRFCTMCGSKNELKEETADDDN